MATRLPCGTLPYLLGLVQWSSQDDDILDVGALGEQGERNVHDVLFNDKNGCLGLVQSKGNVTRIHCHSQGHLKPVQGAGRSGEGDSSVGHVKCKQQR